MKSTRLCSVRTVLLILGLSCCVCVAPWSTAHAPMQGQTWACAPAPPQGGYVAIAEESALIVWDNKNKRQHFIRRATFNTRTAGFGFLVPTPTQPELAEANNAIFDKMEDWTKPEMITRVVERDPTPRSRNAVGSAPAGSVQVLGVKRLAGYQATILKANDTEKLRQWLAQRGYDARPALMAWLDPYVKQEWIITAFQIDKKQPAQQQVGTSAVLMSFDTERPFFPYSEPRDMRNRNVPRWRPRVLRIFLVSDERMEGSLTRGQPRWPGKTVWANTLNAQQTTTLTQKVAPGKIQVPEGAWLTVLEDRSSPRPGTDDVFFSAALAQVQVKRPPIVRTIYQDRDPSEEFTLTWVVIILLGGLFGLAVMALGVIWLVRRMSQVSSEESM